MNVRLADLLNGFDDEKLVDGILDVMRQQAAARRTGEAEPQLFRDLRMLDDAWYRVPNGGYSYLLETREDSIRPLREACERFGHSRAVAELDVVRQAFPGGEVPDTWAAREPFLEAVERANDSVFYDEAVVPAIAAWLRGHRSVVLAFDRVVEVPPDPGELVPDAPAEVARRWLQALGCDAETDATAAGATIRRVRLPRFRRDLDWIHASLARWRGAASIESLSVVGTHAPYWLPIRFEAFSGLREFDAQNSGMTDEDAQRLLQLPHLERGNFFYALGLSEQAKRRLRERLPGDCRF